MNRRQGHIRQRGRRSFEIKYDISSDTGERVTRFRSFKGTRRDAEKELSRLVTEAADGKDIDPSRTTLTEFLDRWERDWAADNLAPKTLERHRELARLHVRPHLGERPLQKLKPVHFAELYAKLRREGRTRTLNTGAKVIMPPLAPRTVGHVHRLLHRALGHAVIWGLVPTNPVSSVEPPKVQSVEIEILSESQTHEVLTKLRDHPVYRLAALALATGMRRGELLALRWADIDFDATRLRVEQSLEQTKAGLRFKAPKTKHGRRNISLPPSIIGTLRALRTEQQALRLKLGLGKAPEDGLVFADYEGNPRSPSTVTNEWRHAVAHRKLPRVSLHALRHTHASQLIASGMDVLTISRRLGHASPTITLGVYGHLFTNTDDRAAQVIEAAFAKVPTE